MEILIVCAGTVGFFVVLFSFILLMRYLSYRETLALAEKGLVRPARSGGSGRGILIWGVVITAIGLALTLGLWPIGLSGSGPWTYPLGFGPWMLVGLIPLFFGLALMLIHVLTRGDEQKAEPPVGDSDAGVDDTMG